MADKAHRLTDEKSARTIVTDAFSDCEKRWWGDELYESVVDNNVFTPAQYVDNWRVIKQTNDG